MTQPALIIGLGGTGRWVLTGIKKNLLEIHGGTMPSQVRLLSFDTVAEPNSNGLVAEPVQIGGVQLTASEYVFLSGQIYNVCQDIVGNRDTLPHLRTWFQAETYLQRLARDDFTLSRGAGQQRPFGRMALFLDLQAHSQSLVANRITQALREVRSGKEKVTIYIVASLSGGTGSGMFIDMAHLVRVIAGQHPVTIRGFLALQNAFGTVEHPMHIEPNTGAALRELDRFMHIFDQSYTITYSPQIPDRGKTTYGAGSGRLFDGCYLIDAERDRNPLARYKPLEGVYPSIADAITTLLDPSVGSKFDQDAQNVATRSSNAQMQADVPHYSSIGTYTLIFPSEDIITSLSYRFARELVGTWLLQVQEQTQKGTKTLRVTYAGNPRHEVDAFLQQPPSLNRRENSTFLDRTPTYIADINNQVNIEDVALYSAEALASWLQPVGEDTSAPARTGGITINEILARNLYESVIPKLKQDQDNPQIIASIIALVKAFREEIFGYKTDERWIGGIYRVALDRCIEVQKQEYRTLLLEQMTILLKTATDPALQHEQRGRLGFVRDFLRALGEGFGRLATFFEKVKVARKGQPPIPSLREDLQRAVDESRRAMNNTSGERQLGFLPPVIRGWFLKAEQAQDAYLSAEQELINYEMADLLIDALQKTAIALGEVTATFHEEVESWIKTLVEGISGEENDPSLYQRLVQAEEAHQRMRKAKAEIPIHEYVTDAAYEDALYESHLVRKLNEIMAHLQWAVTLTPQREAVRIQMTTLQVNRHGNTREERERVHRHNLDYLLSLARSYLAKPLHDQRIADLIEGKGEPPEALARRLHAKCSPLLSFDPNRGGRQEFHYYVCLKEDSKRDFFASLPDAFKQITDQAINYEVIPSADPHRCTILAAADVIPSSAIHPCLKASQSYDTYAHNARLLHIFPAEVNAVAYEQRLPEIFEERRRFNMRLAAMLEDQQLVKQFVLCFLYSFIDLNPVGSGESCYVLNLELPELVRHTAVGQRPTAFTLTAVSSQPTLTAAMETFIFKRTDIGNRAKSISALLVEYTLCQHEAKISNGVLIYESRRQTFTVDHSANNDGEERLIAQIIGCLNERIKLIQPVEISFEAPSPGQQIANDLVALMKLVVEDLVQGIRLRMKARNSQGLTPPRLPSDGSRVVLSTSGAVAPQAMKSTLPAAINDGPRYHSGGLVGIPYDFTNDRKILDDLQSLITPKEYEHFVQIHEIEQALSVAHESDPQYRTALGLLQDALNKNLISPDKQRRLQQILEFDHDLLIGATTQKDFVELGKRVDQLQQDQTITPDEAKLRHAKLKLDWAFRNGLLSQEQYAQAIKKLADW